METELRNEMRNEIPVWEKANLTLKEAAQYSNIGINRLTLLIKSPRCNFVIHVGNKNLIKRKEFEKYLLSVSEL